MTTTSRLPQAPNLFDPETAACPHVAYRRLLSEMPVSAMPLSGSPIIARYDDVMFALRHPEIFSSELESQLGLGTERPMIPQQIDPPAQTKYRKLLDPLFSRKRMKELEPSIRRSARALIASFADAGHCELARDLAIPLPCQAFLHLLGLPLEDLDLFLRLKDGIIRPHALVEDPGDRHAVAEIRARAGKEIYGYFEQVIARRREQPREDLLSHLVAARIDGHPLGHEEILDICFLQLLAGLDTVTATLGCSLAYLAENPAQRRKLVAQPARIENAVEELLRWETPVTGVPRLIRKPVEVAGATLQPGQVALLLLGAANLDPGEFAAADTVDLDRERNRQIAFGGGPHRCLGSHLARMELRVTLEEWHARIPDYAIEPGERPVYSAGIREVRYLPLVWAVDGRRSARGPATRP